MRAVNHTYRQSALAEFAGQASAESNACNACPRCRGTGRFTARSGAVLGDCFACSGSGKTKPAEPKASAIEVQADALHAAFDRAIAAGLKRPRITLDGVIVKPAGANSRNPGALYVTEGETYLGKVVAGRFVRSGPCSQEQAQSIADLIADPKRAAEAYGIRTGRCCICSRELTDSESVERGIGPVCAEKFGF